MSESSESECEQEKSIVKSESEGEKIEKQVQEVNEIKVGNSGVGRIVKKAEKEVEGYSGAKRKRESPGENKAVKKGLKKCEDKKERKAEVKKGKMAKERGKQREKLGGDVKRSVDYMMEVMRGLLKDMGDASNK